MATCRCCLGDCSSAYPTGNIFDSNPNWNNLMASGAPGGTPTAGARGTAGWQRTQLSPPSRVLLLSTPHRLSAVGWLRVVLSSRLATVHSCSREHARGSARYPVPSYAIGCRTMRGSHSIGCLVSAPLALSTMSLSCRHRSRESSRGVGGSGTAASRKPTLTSAQPSQQAISTLDVVHLMMSTSMSILVPGSGCLVSWRAPGGLLAGGDSPQHIPAIRLQHVRQKLQYMPHGTFSP